MTQSQAFTAIKSVIVPFLVASLVAFAGFALGHTQLDGHPVMSERVNDALIRVGRLEVEAEMLEEKAQRLEVEGIDDRFRGNDAKEMEARIVSQLSVIRGDIDNIRSELNRVKVSLGLK